MKTRLLLIAARRQKRFLPTCHLFPVVSDFLNRRRKFQNFSVAAGTLKLNRELKGGPR